MVVEDLLTAPGLAALAAAALALVALALAAALALKLRRVRSAQVTVLGGHEQRDLVTHAERLESGFLELRDWVEDSLTNLDGRSQAQDERIEGTIAYRAVIRYDAYSELSGQQSTSLALLDSGRSGVIVSSILHRDQARVYVKQVHQGHSEIQLSPEEEEAIATALASGPSAVR